MFIVSAPPHCLLLTACAEDGQDGEARRAGEDPREAVPGVGGGRHLLRGPGRGGAAAPPPRPQPRPAALPLPGVPPPPPLPPHRQPARR